MGKFSSFVKGLVIGGGIALLLSPKPGKEIRKDLADKADETLDKVMDYTDQAQSQGNCKRSRRSSQRKGPGNDRHGEATIRLKGC